MRRLQEEIQKQATDSDHDVTAITLALTAGFQHTKATMALQVRPFEAKLKVIFMFYTHYGI